MQDSPTNLIYRHRFETRDLVTDFPPQWDNANKEIVYNVACPPGCSHGGQLTFSRWRKMTLPQMLSIGKERVVFEARENVFGYEPIPEKSPAVEWYLNFAHQDLFCAYGGSLFAQDEMQVAEHPALGSLREALPEKGDQALDGRSMVSPLPFSSWGSERRCEVATDCNAAMGRPFGLYGNEFAQASSEVIRRATRPIDPPTNTNLISMEAPACGEGEYSLEQKSMFILSTAYTGYSAARIESHWADTETLPGSHPHWFLGVRGLRRQPCLDGSSPVDGRLPVAEVDGLVFHTHHELGTDAFEQARRILESDLTSGADIRLRFRCS